MNQTLLIQALLLLKGVNRKTVYKLYKSSLLAKSDDELFQTLYKYFNNRNIYFTIEDFNNKIKQAEQIFHNAQNNNIEVISIADKIYPSRFRNVDDPPVILFYKGDLSHFEKGINIAVIGTREPSSHGAKIAERLGKHFAEKGCNVISGLAIGCDTFAHRGCLIGGGKTLAVLPGGLDIIYPSSNRELAEHILKSGGALVSEYPPRVKPFRSYYVDRDRLQSAFSEAIVVVETDIKGGTMHTVEFAKNQRRILAVYKHPEKYLLEPKCQGNIRLLNADEAFPIDSEDSIVELIQRAVNSKIENEMMIANKIPEPEQQRFDI